MTNGTYQINSPENSERCLFLRFAHIHTHTQTHTHTHACSRNHKADSFSGLTSNYTSNWGRVCARTRHVCMRVLVCLLVNIHYLYMVGRYENVAGCLLKI